MIRFEWVHAKASVECFDEEVHLLKAESSRIQKTFPFMAEEWKRQTRLPNMSNETDMERGWRALCLQHAATFRKLENIATKVHQQLCIIQVSK